MIQLVPDEIDINEPAANVAIDALTTELSDVLAPALIRRIAYIAIKNARETIEQEQRIKDAAIALAGSTVEVETSHLTVIQGNWRKSEYGQVVSDEILKASPSYVEPEPVVRGVYIPRKDDDPIEVDSILKHLPLSLLVADSSPDHDGRPNDTEAQFPMPPSIFADKMRLKALARQNASQLVD